MNALAQSLVVPESNAPGWLRDHWAVQAEHFRKHGVPQPRLENWKYTALRLLEHRDFGVPDDRRGPEPEDLPDLNVPGARWRAVFVDGRFEPRLSVLEDLPEGVHLTSLADADETEFAALRGQLAVDYEAPDEALAALCAAGSRDGLILRIDAGVRLEEAIGLINVSVKNDAPAIHNQRNVIRLGDAAELELIERYVAHGPAENFCNVLTSVELSARSRLRQVRLQQCADQGILVTRQDCRQAAGSQLDYFGFDLGGKLVRHDLNCSLDQPRAGVRLNGVYALEGKRHVDNHTRVDHVAPDTCSEEFFKGVLNGRSRAVFNGKVVVHRGADKTDASQTNKNLVLSPHAEVDTKPELEIYADDVKCAHGATVGQLDELQLFYLRTRGLPEEEARLLLTYAFCRDVIDRIERDALAAFLTDCVVAHLPARKALEGIDS